MRVVVVMGGWGTDVYAPVFDKLSTKHIITRKNGKMTGTSDAVWWFGRESHLGEGGVRE